MPSRTNDKKTTWPSLHFLLLFCVLWTCGCGSKEPAGGPRVETVPVTGIVKVDGQPAAMVKVAAIHSRNLASPVELTPSAITSADGAFELSTYETGDGVPPGDYQVTFVWGEINIINGQYGGDKFQGRYAIPEHSAILLTIGSGDDPVDLGTIELTSK